MKILKALFRFYRQKKEYKKLIEEFKSKNAVVLPNTAELIFEPNDHGILEPVWMNLMTYWNIISSFRRGIRRWGFNSNNEGLQNNLRILREDIAAGTGIPLEMLTEPNMIPERLSQLTRQYELLRELGITAIELRDLVVALGARFGGINRYILGQGPKPNAREMESIRLIIRNRRANATGDSPDLNVQAERDANANNPWRASVRGDRARSHQEYMTEMMETPPVNNVAAQIDETRIERELMSSYGPRIIVSDGGQGFIPQIMCNGTDMRPGSLITRDHELNEIGLAQDDDIIRGVIIRAGFPLSIDPWDIDEFFPDNSYVDICINPNAHVRCFIGGRICLIRLSQVIGLTVNSLVLQDIITESQRLNAELLQTQIDNVRVQREVEALNRNQLFTIHHQGRDFILVCSEVRTEMERSIHNTCIIHLTCIIATHDGLERFRSIRDDLFEYEFNEDISHGFLGPIQVQRIADDDGPYGAEGPYRVRITIRESNMHPRRHIDIKNPERHDVPEFKVNEYITLRLIRGRTKIFVNGALFDQCKFLLLNLKPGKEYKKIESINEAAKVLDRSMETNHEIIPPETEFWGHCSNLQAWVENGYDLRVIHTNLGFPLLGKLCELGDKTALGVMKDEIFLRVEKGGFNALKTLASYQRYLTDEEQESLKALHRRKILSNTEIAKILDDIGILETVDGVYSFHEFNAGIDRDDDVSAWGDFIHSLTNVREDVSFDFGIEIENQEIIIVSDIETRKLAETGVHFNRGKLIESTELFEVESTELFEVKSRGVKQWVMNSFLYRQLIFVINGHLIYKSGELTW